MSFQITPATRQGIIPILGLWGGTGGGKTESALRLARGLAGPSGNVDVIDTEGRRASYYVDRIPGGFNSIDFAAPYTPERYIEAIDMMEKHATVGVIDSASHCWEGPDGILDLHEQALDRMCGNKADDYKERDRLNWPAWREPKMRWKVLRNRILACKIPLIICFRGEEKTRMEKVDGRNTVVTDRTTTPIFDKKFIFEMHVAMEVYQINGKGGFIRFPQPWAKTSHAEIRKLLPVADDEQLDCIHGERLKQWCASPGGNGNGQSKAPVDERKAVIAEIWKQLKDVRGPEQNWLAAEIWLVAKKIIKDTESVPKLTIEQLRDVLAKIEIENDVPTP